LVCHEHCNHFPNPLPFLMLALVYGVSPIGSFWMLYMVIRYEKRPLPWLLLAFIPYFSFGYYFHRVRGRRNLKGDLRTRTLL
jgi:hypothetical protein